VPGCTYLVGYSGGLDSTVLLHVLHTLARELPVRIVAAHLNHGLRGTESDADASACARFCDEQHIPCVTARIDVAQYAAEQHLSLEDAARRCRFRWFCDVARDENARAIFLAHHADDQAETVLLRLVRGAGLRGLAGIKPVAQFRGLTIIRPWLSIARATLLACARTHALPYREDSSNASQRFDRNWMRHEIIPRLAARHGDLAARIGASAVIAHDAEEYLSQRATELLRHFGAQSLLGMLFPLQEYRALHPALQRAIIRRMFDELCGEDPPPASFQHVEDLRALACGTQRMLAQPLPLPFQAGQAFEHVFLGRAVQRLQHQTLPPRGAVALANEMTLEIEPVAARGASSSDNGELWRDAACGRTVCMTQYAALPPHAQLALRPRAPGDSYRPVNGHAHKVKDLLIAARIPRALKDAIPLIACGERIVWLAGWRIADEFAVHAGAQACRLSLLISGRKITTIS